ncbi:MAG: hypothetical protein JWO42_3813, partial [Chloroflexi bacterium]|nr:hypothetical protein [Chloroflexota bacterium]
IAESGARKCGDMRLIARETALERGDLVARARTVAARVCERSAELRARGTQGAAWLEPRYAMSTFGMSPVQIWQLGLDEIVRLAQMVERVAPSVEPWALAFRQPVEWDIDGGFHGVIALLEQTEGMLEQAAGNWEIDLGEPIEDPYAFALSSPFHLVAGSYLAALGRATSAALLCRAFAVEVA